MATALAEVLKPANEVEAFPPVPNVAASEPSGLKRANAISGSVPPAVTIFPSRCTATDCAELKALMTVPGGAAACGLAAAGAPHTRTASAAAAANFRARSSFTTALLGADARLARSVCELPIRVDEPKSRGPLLVR